MGWDSIIETMEFIKANRTWNIVSAFGKTENDEREIIVAGLKDGKVTSINQEDRLLLEEHGLLTYSRGWYGKIDNPVYDPDKITSAAHIALAGGSLPTARELGLQPAIRELV